ncbi:UTP--glucose-1-phosphate uridylyltransferase [Salinispora arenicola]|uniref:UTP--glucose-1-phosphate uridylyltransferase n=2 Tax=Salinispora arenicola TaxID=168697 RepID=A0A542XI60_SALAC|nr:UTP--glucose-1-phosphate uridylyltransferase [Salinispora arenicola]MCN0152288.1 UTP--glucose-1-phosphate uridylyltransferase [Salinispora arenicola]MCN0177393.1 UTP--glucose-1-phosphate uridylyltransferase [Salinispora arenicola]NIL42071.1 UTP--glucose-1-phosphate uridylyltransferase [Salinispora arenicola]NIL57359.1 UTP--glucose-1-phosphate uridylyltransferase [Salinispora arenicola]NIL62002.1 UTP--glucose-1-phosphate uridylyltransferase [Salinispora arenicola]
MSEHSANPSSTATTTGGHRAVKAVIPAAGLATRFLPATKAVPKELLPVVDRPVLQYIVEEATQAGITDILLVTGRGKTSMIDHFDRRPDLEERLAKKPDLLAAVKQTEDLAAIYSCRQPEQLGLGHAVGCAESHVGEQPFAVLLGDEFVKPTEPLLPAMLELQARTGGVVLAFFEVDPAETTRYGIASVAPAEPEFADIADVVRVTGMVEKPKPEDAPSNLAVLGRYVLPGRIFNAIHRTEPGSGGEIQLTDAMEILRTEGVPVHAIVYRGTRYDTGMPLGYLQTVVQIAAERDDLGAEFRKWLAEFVNADEPGGPST